jgi:hypothetical protein
MELARGEVNTRSLISTLDGACLPSLSRKLVTMRASVFASGLEIDMPFVL